MLGAGVDFVEGDEGLGGGCVGRPGNVFLVGLVMVFGEASWLWEGGCAAEQ